MGTMKLTFGKARVRPHVRGAETETLHAVKPYTTRRAPGRPSPRTIWTKAAFDALGPDQQKRALAPPCESGTRRSQKPCPCAACDIWKAIKASRVKDERTAFQKAMGRVDAFLRDRAQKVAEFFKSTPDEDAPVSEEVSTEPHLPWTDNDHASAPPAEEEPQPEVEYLVKARAVQAELQKAIQALDEKLQGELPDAERGHLLAEHLDFLIKADALTTKIEDANRELTTRPS